jgi:hypothetical protein
MTDEEAVYEREDLNLFYRRKYFVFTSDRRRGPSYGLEQDQVAKNTVEFRTEQLRKLRVEEAEAMAETLIGIHEKKKIKERLRKKRREKIEEDTEKRWKEVNKILWNQQQRRNEAQKKMRQMRDEMVKKGMVDKGKVKHSQFPCLELDHLV